MAGIGKLMKKEICCIRHVEILKIMATEGFPADAVLNGIIGNPDYLVEGNDGEAVPVDQQYLGNRKNWVSNDLSLHVFKNVAQLIGGERPLFRVGLSVFNSKVSGLVGILLRLAALHPPWLITGVFELPARYSKVRNVALMDYKKESGMRIQIRCVDQNMTPSTLDCDYNEGGLVGFSSIFAKNVRSTKVRHVSKGEECCDYVISWEKRGRLERLFRSASPAFQLMQDDMESAGYVPDEDARTL